jgi:hypothetical protein
MDNFDIKHNVFDLDPPTLPERTASDVRMELLAITNEIQQLQLQLGRLKGKEFSLQKELQLLETSIFKRSQRNIDNERKYKEKFVMDEVLGDVIDID